MNYPPDYLVPQRFYSKGQHLLPEG